jgi:hypothetical protein
MSASHRARLPAEVIARRDAERAAADQRRLAKTALREEKRLAKEADRTARKVARTEALAAARESRKTAEKEARALLPRKKGWKLSAETKARMSSAKKGRPLKSWSPERKAASSIASKTRPLAGAVTRTAGWHHTPETRAKMKATWESKRATQEVTL